MRIKTMLGTLGAIIAVNSSVAIADQGGDDEQFQAEKIRIHCQSDGDASSMLGQSQVDLEADLKFTLKVRDDGVRVIEEFGGNISLDPGQAVSQTLVARFENEGATENVDFHPRVYKGFSQFRNINATSVVGEQALTMVGNFLIEKNIDKEKIRAVYQFQAGDSMGGTLHFTCKKQF